MSEVPAFLHKPHWVTPINTPKHLVEALSLMPGVTTQHIDALRTRVKDAPGVVYELPYGSSVVLMNTHFGRKYTLHLHVRDNSKTASEAAMCVKRDLAYLRAARDLLRTVKQMRELDLLKPKSAQVVYTGLDYYVQGHTEFVVKRNSCKCHPETCNCDPFAVHDTNGFKHSTFFQQPAAEEVARALTLFHSKKPSASEQALSLIRRL